MRLQTIRRAVFHSGVSSGAVVSFGAGLNFVNLYVLLLLLPERVYAEFLSVYGVFAVVASAATVVVTSDRVFFSHRLISITSSFPFSVGALLVAFAAYYLYLDDAALPFLNLFVISAATALAFLMGVLAGPSSAGGVRTGLLMVFPVAALMRTVFSVFVVINSSTDDHTGAVFSGFLVANAFVLAAQSFKSRTYIRSIKALTERRYRLPVFATVWLATMVPFNGMAPFYFFRLAASETDFFNATMTAGKVILLTSLLEAFFDRDGAREGRMLVRFTFAVSAVLLPLAVLYLATSSDAGLPKASVAVFAISTLAGHLVMVGVYRVIGPHTSTPSGWRLGILGVWIVGVTLVPMLLFSTTTARLLVFSGFSIALIAFLNLRSEADVQNH